MIERYSIKFGPAVSQKELEKKLHDDLTDDELKRLRLMKARIEIIGDYLDIQKIVEKLKDLSRN